MAHVIDDLKARARLLQRSAQTRDPAALRRLRALDELRALDDDALAQTVRRRHCLGVLARELGFRGWPHATAVLRGAPTDDFGTLLCPPGSEVHWNIWSASYEEARALREETGGYLLAYRRHFLIVDRHYIETLGLDPEDPDWERMDRDWARPADPEARTRLYQKLVRSGG